MLLHTLKCCAHCHHTRGHTDACLHMSGVDAWQALLYSLEVAPIDSMSCAYNATLLRLSEDFPEVHTRDDS